MTNAVHHKTKRPAKWPLIALTGIPVVTILFAAVWLYIPGIEQPVTTNMGYLIEPAKSVVTLSDELSDSRWNMVVLIKNTCDTSCKNRLAVIRNAHWALGKDAWRVRRSAIFLGAPDPANESIRQNFPEMSIINLPLSQFNQWRLYGVTTISEPFHLGVLVIDPLGYAFIYYNTEHTGNNIIIDMRKLLRYSNL